MASKWGLLADRGRDALRGFQLASLAPQAGMGSFCPQNGCGLLRNARSAPEELTSTVWGCDAEGQALIDYSWKRCHERELE